MSQPGAPHSTPGAVRTLRVSIGRSAPEARSEFTVEARDPVTVLDLLAAVQRLHDPSLAFRYSCRVQMCGTCGVRVNGRSTLACRTVVPEDVDKVEIEPLAGLAVVRDLVVDMRPFWAQWASVKPWFVPAAAPPGRIPPGSAEADSVDRTLGCISCGACYSTCGIAGSRSDYIGPAALNRALALIADPRDGARRERLGLVTARGGVDRCHYIGGCTSACPVGLDPARSIVELRRLRVAGRG